MVLQCVFGCDQPLGDQCLMLLESLSWHRHGYGDRVTKRIVQRNSSRANSEGVFVTVIGDAALARSLEIAKERIQSCERVRRARFVSAADESLNGIIGKLRQIRFPVRSAVERKGVPDRGNGTQTLRPDDLIDKHKMVFLHSR